MSQKSNFELLCRQAEVFWMMLAVASGVGATRADARRQLPLRLGFGR